MKALWLKILHFRSFKTILASRLCKVLNMQQVSISWSGPSETSKGGAAHHPHSHSVFSSRIQCNILGFLSGI